MRKPTRNQELFEFLLHNRGATYSMAAKRFGISRQRVFQIMQALAAPTKSPQSRRGIAQTLNRPKNQRNTVYGTGLYGQKKFEEECAKRGYAYEARWEDSSFDYLVNGLRVEVKCASGKRIKDFDVFSFSFVKNKDHFDILACCCGIDNWFFFTADFLREKYPGGGITFKVRNGEMTNRLLKDRSLTWGDVFSV